VKTLITGGAGFIGSHLAERLLHEGHTVAIIDDLSTGSIHNIEHVEDNPRFSIVIDTVENEEQTERLVEDCDVVFHLAAAVGVKYVIDNPIRAIENNVNSTAVILRLANRYRRKILLASTSEVYGKSDQMPFTEDDDRVQGATSIGRWSYACSKALDEFLGLAYWKEKRCPTIVARLFNTVGPRQAARYGMVIPRFVQWALAGEPILVYGDGKQSRCFSYVGDVVEALVRLIGCREALGEVINVGSDEEITIEDLAKKIKTLTNSSSEIVYVPYEKAYVAGFEDMRRRKPSLDKLESLIGFKPSMDIDEILKRVIVFCREQA